MNLSGSQLKKQHW